MKTLLYSAFDTLEIAERPRPEITPDEVLLHVAACGICGSELEGVKNRSPRRTPPLVLGHEFCGVIEELGGAVTGFEVGQKVVSNALVPCGDCLRCKRGDGHLCAERQIFGMKRLGAFSEFVNVPARVLLAWPDNLPAQAACLAEPLANGVHMLHLSQHLRPRAVLVIGAGPIGLMAQQVFQAVAKAEVFVADMKPERIKVASKLGAQAVFNPGEVDLVQELRDRTDGEGVDLVIDAAGLAVTKRQSIAAARPGGAAIWIGLHDDEMKLNSFEVTLGEKQVLGTYAASIANLQEALDLMASGQVDVTSWVDSFPLEQGVQAFNRMLVAAGTDIKAVLLPGGAS